MSLRLALCLAVACLCVYSVSANRAARQATETPAPKPSCPKNAEWLECTNLCPDKSCDNYMSPSPCFSLRCGEPRCQCKPGHVLLSSANQQLGCVPRETCRKLDSLKSSTTAVSP